MDIEVLASKFQGFIDCAQASGDEVSDEMLLTLNELCERLSIRADNLIGEIAKRDGLVRVRLDTGKTVLCFPDELQPCE